MAEVLLWEARLGEVVGVQAAVGAAVEVVVQPVVEAEVPVKVCHLPALDRACHPQVVRAAVGAEVVVVEAVDLEVTAHQVR